MRLSPTARACIPALACAIGLAACAGPAAAETFPGPVSATVLRVLDGDTFVAEARLWPGHVLTVNVRLRGIDAPEMRARCAGEREAAERARDLLGAMIGGREIRISNIAGAKYYGRVLADAATAEGRDVAPAMIELEAARPYRSGKRGGWC